jgi:hypothetical protein
MSARGDRGPRRCAACLVALIGLAPLAAAGQALRAPGSAPEKAATAAAPSKPKRFLIHLLDGQDPIVVERYVEAGDEIRFEKFGGWVAIPRYEIRRIVPDEPDQTVTLPPPPPEPEPEPATAPPPPTPADTLYVTMRGGAEVRATGIAAEGERLRITVPDGSFTVARSDLLGVIRMPGGAGTPEAWITLLRGEGEPVATERPASPPGGPASAAAPVAPPAAGASDGAAARPAGPGGPAAPGPAPWQPPYPSSEQPHLVRLANGQRLRVDSFWIEDGEIRFRRLGGLVGMALAEVVRLVPESIAPVHGRTPVRFGRRLAPDLIEVRVQSGVQRVRLIGVEPVPDAHSDEAPWLRLALGLVVYLEFDRQRYAPDGDWLAYVFLPNGRMLNAELIRLGLARPRADGRNLRYLDLFQELAEPSG